MKKPANYSELIHPIFEEVNVSEGDDVWLDSYSQVEQPAGRIYAAHLIQCEVNNGGFDQLFWNGTGLLTPEAVHGFLLIGMPTTASVINSAIEAFGSTFPLDRHERQEALKSIPKDVLDRFDKEFYAEIETENGGFEAAADAFTRTLGE